MHNRKRGRGRFCNQNVTVGEQSSGLREKWEAWSARKQGTGKATGDDELAGEGVMDQRAGAGRDTVGKAANAVSDTVHDQNR
jgi:uncharacterized protein YjbJ (UPF0337 family)